MIFVSCGTCFNMQSKDVRISAMEHCTKIWHIIMFNGHSYMQFLDGVMLE